MVPKSTALQPISLRWLSTAMVCTIRVVRTAMEAIVGNNMAGFGRTVQCCSPPPTVQESTSCGSKSQSVMTTIFTFLSRKASRWATLFGHAGPLMTKTTITTIRHLGLGLAIDLGNLPVATIALNTVGDLEPKKAGSSARESRYQKVATSSYPS